MRSNDPLLLPSKIFKKQKKKASPTGANTLAQLRIQINSMFYLQNIKYPPWVISLIDPSLCSNPAHTQPECHRPHCNLLHFQLGHVSTGWDSERLDYSFTHEYPRSTLLWLRYFGPIPSSRASFPYTLQVSQSNKWLRPIDSVIGPVRVKRFRTVSYISASLMYIWQYQILATWG